MEINNTTSRERGHRAFYSFLFVNAILYLVFVLISSSVSPNDESKEITPFHVEDIFHLTSGDSVQYGDIYDPLNATTSTFNSLKNQAEKLPKTPKLKLAKKTNSMITNDIPWNEYRTHKILETNKGGKITKINDKFYWIGSVPGFLLMYQSPNLGSKSWTLAKKIPHKNNNKNPECGGCQLQQHPEYDEYYIFCKSRQWFKQHLNGPQDLTANNTIGREGPIDPTIGTYKLLPMPKDPSSVKKFHLGGQSVFLENNILYFIVSRCHHNQPKSRKLFIYTLNSQWTEFENEVISFNYKGRESPWLLKRNGWYYLFVSQTQGWKQSKTYYKMSTSIEGLKDSAENQVVMHPHDTKFVKSMGSQFRFMIQLDYNDGNDGDLKRGDTERWIFGGDRYPVEGPQFWDSKYGRNVIVPMNFVDDVPHVYWKEEFDWKTYDYGSGDFDNQRHARTGYGPSHSPLVSANEISLSID